MAGIYLLDTDTCSYIIRDNPASVVQHLWTHRNDDIRISAVTRAELLYGARLKKSVRLLRQVRAFIDRWDEVAFDAKAADAYAEVLEELHRKGTPIGNMDVMIAACAKAAGAVLVTNNRKHFSLVPGLKIENWVS